MNLKTKIFFFYAVIGIFISSSHIAKANSQYTATGKNLVTGTQVASDVDNTADERGTYGNDGNFWRVARVNPNGLNAQLQFDGVREQGANKIIITLEDSNITTADAFNHQICDWVTTTDVDNVADAQCTGGGWRTLQPRKTAYTSTADTTRVYEIYNGYFWDTASAPGTVVSTPVANFIEENDQRVLIRFYSTVNSTTNFRIDQAMVEVAIDPIYEPALFTKTTGGTVTGSISDLIGATATGVTGSDNSRVTIPMPAISQAADIYYTFKNVKTYTGMNTFVVIPEMNVSNVALTVGVYMYDFTNTTWTQHGSNKTLTTGDVEYAWSFNDTAIGSFDFSDYISSSGEVRVRFATNTPGTVYNMVFDRIYMMVGSVNTDSAMCEISWGTGTATNCVNTRSVGEGKTVAPTTSTWQPTIAIEYPTTFYSSDNDDDANNAEYAVSTNLSFPVTLTSGMVVTATHYAAKYRSNVATITVDLGIKDQSGLLGISGWAATPGTDTNASTTYGWYDTWALAEYQSSLLDVVNMSTNTINLRLRTSTSTSTTAGTVSDWDFAFVSIRWVEANRTRTVQRMYQASGGTLVTGTETATSTTNTGGYKAVFGSDSGTNGSGNYWTTARVNPNGMDKQIYFDGVQLHGANKLIIGFEDTNITTGNAYQHQICDWVSSTSVDTAAGGNCTGGGWRTLQPRKTDQTSTSDTQRVYNIYDGYFSTRSASPGTIIDTPLTNFINTSSGNRVLVRTYSTVASTVQHRTDWVYLETAIDPIYEPASFTKTTGGTTTGFISDVVGAVWTGVNASDNNRLTIPMPAISQAVDAYFTFKDVETYGGMNSVLILPETNVSNVALTVGVYLYNFDTSAWTQLGSNKTLTTGDIEYAWIFNDTTVSGFDINDYVSSSKELRVRFFTNTPGTVYNFTLDRLYVMLGSVNSDTGLCQITWGTGTATDCDNTRDVDEGKTVTPTTTTWQATSALEYPTNYASLDNDDDATGAEYAVSQNLIFPVTIGSNFNSTGIHYAVKYRSNNTTMTTDLQVRDFSGTAGTSGWVNTPGTDTNALTTYTWFDTWILAVYQTSPYDFIDTTNDQTNLRARTSVSTNTTTATVRDWDFAMFSMRWLRFQPTITTATTGTQETDLDINTTNNYVGGAFTLISNSGSVNIDSIKINEEGTVAANTNLSNVDIYYETADTCTYNGTEDAYATGGSFDGSQQATLTGTMVVGTSQVCVYVVLDVGAGASDGQTIELEISVPETDAVTDYGEASPDTAITLSGTTTLNAGGNTAPNSPSSLLQRKVNDTTLATGDWTNETTVEFTATATDTDNPDDLQLCIEVDLLGVSFSNTEDSCGSAVTYSGSGVTVIHSIASLTDASEYHWQARLKDTAGGYSSWVSYGGNAESARDFGTDTTAPTSGTIYDGSSVGVDGEFNDGSLSQLSANWSGFNSNTSGLNKYQYSIGTAAGGTQVVGWTDNSTTTSVTASGLTLQTSIRYYFNVRAVDNAGNTQTAVSSNGQIVAPTLTFTVAPSSVTFSNLSPTNSYNDTETTTLTVSTNAYNGYIIKAYISDLLRSTANPSFFIPGFDGGTYASPDQWLTGDRGFGYSSSDTSVAGSNKFQNNPCPGGGTPPCYAPFATSAPGDIVADHTSTVTGSPISAEEFTITYQVKTEPVQEASVYNTTVVYTITAIY